MTHVDSCELGDFRREGARGKDSIGALLAININKRYHEMSFKYFAELEALRKGCYVKDTQGLVDFYPI